MGAFSVEVAAVVVDTAVVQGAEAHKAVLQGVVALLVHVVVPDHVLLAGEPLESREKGKAGQEGGRRSENQNQRIDKITITVQVLRQRSGGAASVVIDSLCKS